MHVILYVGVYCNYLQKGGTYGTESLSRLGAGTEGKRNHSQEERQQLLSLQTHISSSPGGKKPIPVDTYIGRITPNGVEKGARRKVNLKNSNIIVREYGFSRAVELLCTDGWKEALGDGIWERMLCALYWEIAEYVQLLMRRVRRNRPMQKVFCQTLSDAFLREVRATALSKHLWILYFLFLYAKI